MDTTQTFTILDEGRVVEVLTTIDGDHVFLGSTDLEKALSWELKPEGFCRDSICVPIPNGSTVVSDGAVDLTEFAKLIDRPLAIDTEERAAYLGTSAGTRAKLLSGLEAPNFTLPDLNGKTHSLSDYRGRKVLLVAYASW